MYERYEDDNRYRDRDQSFGSEERNGTSSQRRNSRYRNQGSDRDWKDSDSSQRNWSGRGDYSSFNEDRNRDDDVEYYSNSRSGRGSNRRSGSSGRQSDSFQYDADQNYYRENPFGGQRSSSYGPWRTSPQQYDSTRGGSSYGDSEYYSGSKRSDRSFGEHYGKGPKGYKRSDDQIIDEASRRLQECGDVDASEVEVSCDEGIVTLTGKVDKRRTKRRAEECVEQVFGVNDVMNHIRVEKSFFEKLVS